MSAFTGRCKMPPVMSAFGGKADVLPDPSTCLLLARSGRSTHDAGSSLRRSTRIRGTAHTRLVGRYRVNGALKALSRFVVVAEVPAGGRTAVERQRVPEIRTLTMDLT